MEHQKWECPDIEVKGKRRGKKKMAYVARPQKMQQERSPVCPSWKKVQEYCDKWSLPPQGALLLDRGWITEKVVVMYVECGGCDGKDVQTYEN